MDRRSGVIKDIRMLSIVDGAGYVIGVDSVLDVIVMMRRDDVVDEVGLDVVDECRSKSAFHITRACRRGGEIVERMSWTKGARQVLGRQ